MLEGKLKEQKQLVVQVKCRRCEIFGILSLITKRKPHLKSIVVLLNVQAVTFFIFAK